MRYANSQNDVFNALMPKYGTNEIKMICIYEKI